MKKDFVFCGCICFETEKSAEETLKEFKEFLEQNNKHVTAIDYVLYNEEEV